MTLLETLAAWLPEQRWYATKGLAPQLRILASTALPASDPDAEVTVQLLLDEAHASPVLYQVPIVARAAEGAAAIGEVDGRWLHDGPHDPAFVEALLAVMGGAQTVDGDGLSLEGRRLSEPGRVLRSRVLSGEQSNTSVVVEVEGGPVPTLITKVFRVLHHGENPDVTTQSALTAAGSHRVPASFCSLSGTWPDAGRECGTATGHLAFTQQFLPGLQDAWAVAVDAAGRGEDFTEPARELGAAVAEVHRTLASALPTAEATEADTAAQLASLRRRLDIAVREVPQLEAVAPRIAALYDRLDGVRWPTLQRIHGDLHLGQTVRAPGLGWVLLDFEGEPLRPMPERSRPDLALRDIAGMLRSFDYVAGALAQQDPPIDASAWTADARAAFLDGYGGVLEGDRALLDAFEVDKAVYEAIYEVRNRPGWLGIPLGAIDRLVARV
ncbi:maltokinase N-terminal cap-like domain-containing protein [Arenivirga flava]|uniref:Maltokinase n=1 Tax=Arenivirga flava TaxID=1930060 RepID=A0AA37X9K7_9MICO|nr:hypothetical protein [Arenivirga flava]GMA28664.1 trehalose biosynthesis protein [Arenivirga flava]